jgi:pilus assembly protein CpaC
MKHQIKFFALIIVMAVACPSLSQAKETNKEIYLAPGEQEVLPFEKISRIAVGNKNIFGIKFTENRKSLLVIGKNQGISNLVLWDKNEDKTNISVRIIQPELKSLYLEVQKSISDIEGVRASILGEKIVIEGFVYKANDKKKIQSLSQTGVPILDLVKIDTEMLSITASMLEKNLASKGFTKIKVVPAGEKISLQGQVDSKRDLDKVLEISKSYFSDIINNIDPPVEMIKMVLVDLKIAEIRNNASKTLGIKWQESVTLNSQLTFGSGVPAVGTFNLGDGYNTTLNMLISKGLVKILANPKIVCANGRKGTFQAGGEIPIRLIGERNSEVFFKNYGIILEFTAAIDESKRVGIEVNAEISDINMAAAVEGIPGFLKNSFNTAVNMNLGDSMILAGLLTNKASKNVDKLPLLGHIPVIGELFKSRSFNNDESQFAAILTPVAITASSDENMNSLENLKRKMSDTDRKLKAKVLD